MKTSVITLSLFLAALSQPALAQAVAGGVVAGKPAQIAPVQVSPQLLNAVDDVVAGFIAELNAVKPTFMGFRKADINVSSREIVTQANRNQIQMEYRVRAMDIEYIFNKNGQMATRSFLEKTIKYSADKIPGAPSAETVKALVKKKMGL